jgi:hypothetical protein
MVIEGNDDEFVDKLSGLPLHPENYTEMKTFLQNVQNLQL